MLKWKKRLEKLVHAKYPDHLTKFWLTDQEYREIWHKAVDTVMGELVDGYNKLDWRIKRLELKQKQK